MPKSGEPVKSNRAFYTSSIITRFVVASAAKAELGALFHNCQMRMIFRQTLKDLGHPQPKMPVHCDNAMGVGIASNTIKCQQSQSMAMPFFWVGDKVAQEMYDITWHPGIENLADYQSKHHIGLHHVAVRPYYLHQENSPRILPRATRPSTLKGCVGTLESGYVRNIPLARIPRIQITSQVASVLTSIESNATCYLRIAWIPTWSKLSCLPEDFGTIPTVPFSLLLVSVAH